MTSGAGPYLGASIRRKEDSRLLTGRGRYVADIALPRTLHVAFVRSPFAHARIAGIDTSRGPSGRRRRRRRDRRRSRRASQTDPGRGAATPAFTRPIGRSSPATSCATRASRSRRSSPRRRTSPKTRPHWSTLTTIRCRSSSMRKRHSPPMRHWSFLSGGTTSSCAGPARSAMSRAPLPMPTWCCVVPIATSATPGFPWSPAAAWPSSTLAPAR